MRLEYLQSILDLASTEPLELVESHDDLSSLPPLYPPQLAPQARVPTALAQLYEKRQVSLTLATKCFPRADFVFEWPERREKIHITCANKKLSTAE
jgi:hypothetical protein